MLTLIIALLVLPVGGTVYVCWTVVSARKQERQWRLAQAKILADGELEDKRKANASIRDTKVGLGPMGI